MYKDCEDIIYIIELDFQRLVILWSVASMYPMQKIGSVKGTIQTIFDIQCVLSGQSATL